MCCVRKLVETERHPSAWMNLQGEGCGTAYAPEREDRKWETGRKQMVAGDCDVTIQQPFIH